MTTPEEYKQAYKEDLEALERKHKDDPKYKRMIKLLEKINK